MTAGTLEVGVALAPTLEFTADSVRKVGFHDGQRAREHFVNTAEATLPNPGAHRITSPRARVEYHQGWILGRLGAESPYARCPKCHRRHEPATT